MKFINQRLSLVLTTILLLSICTGCAAQKTTPSTPTETQEVMSNPKIGINQTQYSLSFTQGQSNTQTKTIVLANEGGGVMVWAARETAAWMWLNEPDGAIEQGYTKNIELYVSPPSQEPGTYTENIEISSYNATNSPQTIKVVATVNAAPVVTSTNQGVQKKAVPPPPWEFNEYKNDNYNFILRYPKTYVAKQLTIEGATFGAKSSEGTSQADIIMVGVLGAFVYTDNVTMATEWTKNAVHLMGSKPNPKLISCERITLEDGVTPGYELVFESKSASYGSYKTYVYGVQTRNRFIFFGAVSPLSNANEKLPLWKEIARTLEFVK